ncbi:DUF2911 domain-containing protein [Flectobacillus major]|jgi:tetratricopeptide (TPR) repeat protein|uniref:DUF2911 domain-containing protein n=1 Tax=Flectobacillus major TaxID=103 RepID=UPI0005C5B631|nr:DUF2911 domain-containing protein [Flectobacillus major]
MKKVFLAILVATSLSVSAQVRLPQPSSAASVTQTVGTTDFSIKYSRPNVKGREIFGALLPYDKIWRTGANAATQITLSNDITVNGQKLPAGTYSIFSIPTQGEWTLIFNKDIAASEQSYSQEKDAARVKVVATTTPKVESFSIDFSDITDSTANLNFAWADKKVVAKIGVETSKMIEASIAKASTDNANAMNNAASYLLGKGKLEQALKLANSSVSSIETFRNVWTKAQILAKLGNFVEAVPLAQKALELGKADTGGGFAFTKDAIEKGLAEWTTKLPAITPLKKKK